MKAVRSGKARPRWKAWCLLTVALFLLSVGSADAIGLQIRLEETARVTEHLNPRAGEVGLSLADSTLPILKFNGRSVQTATEINPKTGYVQVRSYYRDDPLNNPLALELRQFNDLRNESQVFDQWHKKTRISLTKTQAQKHGSGLGIEFLDVPKPMESLVGEGGVGLKVNGYRKIMFSGTSRWEGGVQNTGSARQSKFPSLDMIQQSRFTIKGNVGSKVHVSVDQDSKRESDLANRIQIRYKGNEDDILQSIELGNTTLSLPNSKFVGYSQRIQGLFGVKATAQVGHLDLTMITSQEKGNTEKTRFTPDGSSDKVTYLRDYQYLEGVYYNVGEFYQRDDARFKAYQPAVDSIVEFRLYKRGRRDAGDDSYAFMYIDPRDSNETTPEHSEYVEELEQNVDYFLAPSEFWIQMSERQRLRQNEFLACYMEVKRANGEIEFVGTDDADTISLKLLKPTRRNSGNPTWDYEWKYVYSLGARNLGINDFEFDIYKGAPGDEDNPANLNHNEESTPYLQVFGLDELNDNGQPLPDGRIDNKLNILDLSRGHVFFPNERPFDPADGRLGDETVPEIYETSNSTELNNASKYYFALRVFTQRAAVYSLGRINILENSETVTLDNRKLNRGTDYEIDYELGQIRFLTEAALDPNAELNIDYEYAPFISVNKKSLFGMRAEYSTGPALKLGSSFLYKGQKSTDRQPQLGQEQSQDVIAEFDFSYAATPEWMTGLANGVPLVETTKPSRLMLSGEVARSIPNPNSQGYVMLDDFEGTKMSTTLGTLRSSWTKASPPDSSISIWQNRNDSTRAKFIWFNPYNDLLATEIYARDIEEDAPVSDHRIQTLNLEIRPDTLNPEESWGGCMRALSPAYEDQSRAEFLELRVGYDRTINDEGLDGVLHVDLGQISEDLDGDGDLDTEDQPVNGIFNGLLDANEDTGLDGVPDSLEPGYDPVTNPDPNGDNWFYNDNEPNNYDQINGTEGNGTGKYSDHSGIYPDTESINGDNTLDQINDYYSFAIDLQNSKYLVEGSEYHNANSIYTFMTYRIPLWEVSNVDANFGRGDSTLIRFARLWMDGFTERSQVIIAALEIVENRWQAKSLVDTVTSEKQFLAEVINTEENTNYYSPPGVGGFLNRNANFREREQSLLLRFENLAPGDTGWAEKVLTQTEDYTGYQELRMWVHGDTDITPEDGKYSFIFRFGKDEDNYYEYHVDLDTGWTERNSVYLNFDELTPLKSLLPTEEAPDGGLEQWQEPHIKIRGNPSLTQIRYQATGITYVEGPTATLSGDVWANELRLESVRKDQGTAARLSVTADFADLVGFSVNSEIQTYSFRGLTSRGRGRGANLLNGSTRTRHNANTRISLGRFLPASWRVSLPVTVKYTKDVLEPKLITGSDIVLTPELRRKETTTKINHRVSVSERMNLPTKHWLATLTVNALSFSGSYAMEKTWSPRTTGDRETYAMSGKYGLTLKNLLPIHPLTWTKYLFLPEKIWGTRLNLLPKSFNADASVNRVRSNSINSQGYKVFTYSRRFRGAANWSLEPFKSLTGEYGFTTERDLFDPELMNLSLNPRDFQLGVETNFSQRLGVRYSPPFFRFLSPNATYNVDYKEDSDPKRYTNGTRKGVVNANFSAQAGLDFRRILGTGQGGGGRGRRQRAKPRATVVTEDQEEEAPKRDEEKKEETEEKEEEDDGGGFVFKPHKPVLWLLRQLTSPIEPIKGTFRHGESRSTLGMLGRPSFKYRFGLSKDLGIARDPTAISSRDRDSENLTDTYGLQSRINVLGLTRVAVSYEHRKTSVFTTTSTRNQSTTFPKMSTSLDNLDKLFLLKEIPLLPWVLRMVSINMNFTHSTQLSEKIIQDPDDETALTWSKETRTTSDDLGVAVRWSHSFKSGWRINADYNWKVSERGDERFSTNSFLDTRQTNQSIGVSSNYSFRAPNGIRFPLLRSLRLKSTLTLNISAKYDINKTESRNRQAEDPAYIPKQDRSRLSIRTRANYSFSSSMRGGFELNWVDDNDNITNRPRHTRQVSLWIEFSF